jgi:hypothetical protein
MKHFLMQKLTPSELARIVTSLRTQIDVYELEINKCKQIGDLQNVIESYENDIEGINLLINKILN